CSPHFSTLPGSLSFAVNSKGLLVTNDRPAFNAAIQPPSRTTDLDFPRPTAYPFTLPPTPTENAMNPEPQKEHYWLEKLTGEWTYEIETIMGPGQPPVKSRGTETVRSIGGLWVQCEGQGEMPGGGPATVVLALGFDPVKKRFVGTFIGSMMTNLWV